jgi:hypothetical protein
LRIRLMNALKHHLRDFGLSPRIAMEDFRVTADRLREDSLDHDQDRGSQL